MELNCTKTDSYTCGCKTDEERRARFVHTEAKISKQKFLVLGATRGPYVQTEITRF